MSIPMNRVAALSAGSAGFTALDRAVRSRLLVRMNALRECQLTIIDALGESVLGSPAATP